MNSFFLSVSFPRTRREVNCTFRSVATRKHNETLRLWPGSAELCEAIGACVRTQERIVLSFLLQLAPFVSFADTFPVSGDSLKTCILSFL